MDRTRIRPGTALVPVPVRPVPAVPVPAPRPRRPEPEQKRLLPSPPRPSDAATQDGVPGVRLHPLRQRIEYAALFERAVSDSVVDQGRKAHGRAAQRYSEAVEAYRKLNDDNGSGSS
jgi:hypothetical protein